MPTFGGNYIETTANMVHTWSITVPGSKMDLTLWIDKVSAELERTGQCQCWCSCYSRVELAGNHKGEPKQMPLKDHSLKEQRWQ